MAAFGLDRVRRHLPGDAPKPTLDSLIEALGDAPGFVAVNAGEIVGLVQTVDGWLTHLYVDPPHWKRGIGAQLHDAALDRLRADGHAVANLWVLRDNTPARAMYERRGWTLTDVTRPVYAPAAIEDVNYILEL